MLRGFHNYTLKLVSLVLGLKEMKHTTWDQPRAELRAGNRAPGALEVVSQRDQLSKVKRTIWLATAEEAVSSSSRNQPKIQATMRQVGRVWQGTAIKRGQAQSLRIGYDFFKSTEQINK